MSKLVIVGNVKTVLEGKVRKEELLSMNTHDLPFALGTGTFMDGNILCAGEGIIFDEQAYIFVPGKPKTQVGEIKTPFMMGISKKPTQNFKSDKTQTIGELYESLLLSYPKGFAIVGTAQFSKAELAFIKTPPLFNENINENKEKYWARESLNDVTLSIFGVVLTTLNDKAFYQNPNESSENTIYSHTHGLYQLQARHLLTHSILKSTDVFVEEIET